MSVPAEQVDLLLDGDPLATGLLIEVVADEDPHGDASGCLLCSRKGSIRASRRRPRSISLGPTHLENNRRRGGDLAHRPVAERVGE